MKVDDIASFLPLSRETEKKFLQLWKLTAFLSQMGKLPPSVDQEWRKSKSAAKEGNSD
jgi:hypothetical protein